MDELNGIDINTKDIFHYEDEVEKNYGRWFCPTSGNKLVYWKYFLLLNMLIVALIIPCRIAFETKPMWYSVWFEYYMDMVFVIDMIRMFNTPVRKTQYLAKNIFNRKEIALQYVKRWFLLDLYAFFPLAYLRSKSEYEKGSHDNL